MPAQLRSRKSKGDEVDVATHVAEDSTVIVSEEKISKVDLVTDVVSVVRNENWALSVINGSARTFHSQLVLPFWNHLDVRGFGTPQPFICWLVVPFTLSMIVWYVAVMQLLEMGNLLEDLGPLPVYPVTEEFVWGQEL